MATFPALEPDSRQLGYGDFPQTTFEGISGVDVRFRHSTDRIAQILTLGYRFLTETEAQQVLDHYETQQGELIEFDLPSTVWAGYSAVPIPASDYNWRYAEPPEIAIAAPLRYAVTVSLESVQA